MMSLAALALCIAAPADGQAHLQKVDEAINRWTDQFFSYEMIDHQPGKSPRTLGLEVHMLGEKRFTQFTAPAEMKGTRILILSPTRMYVYLPAYKKVRRVASHVSAQGLMGTAYASDDLAVETYSDLYTAKLKSQDDTNLVLDLVAKKGATVPYPQIEMTVEKKRYLPKKFVYKDTDGSLMKTERRGAYKCVGDICAPTKMQMEDHRRPGHKTQLLNKKWKPNSGLKPSLFTKRTLQKGL